jgi:hypothetical protein
MRTNSYVMTVDKNTLPIKHYVKCQGRWGKNNPNYNYRRITFCPLEHAVKWDVYIYRR